MVEAKRARKSSSGFIRAFYQDALRGIESLIFPSTCPCCESETITNLCLRRWQEPSSIRFVSAVPIYSVVPYDDRAMRVVMAAKERGEVSAKKLITSAISSAVKQLDIYKGSTAPIFIMPVPSSKAALRKRGEDFIVGLAKRIAREDMDRLRVINFLQWRRQVADQSRLPMVSRIKNLDSALFIDERRVKAWFFREGMECEANRVIILIDDVITSGSTLAAAISAISHSTLGTSSSLVGITACHSVGWR